MIPIDTVDFLASMLPLAFARGPIKEIPWQAWSFAPMAVSATMRILTEDAIVLLDGQVLLVNLLMDLMAKLNDEHMRRHTEDAEFANRMQSFELAFRMQKEATEVVDLSRETKATQDLYGINDSRTKSYGSKCLMARRLVESGVRFVQVYSDGEWDAHNDLEENHTHHCAATDVPVAGLLSDLEERGLLDSTLVIWGGEFGRMPISQNGKGRDHNPKGFLQWMAGAGIKGGVSYGETDEIGYEAVENRVSVNDLHATILHLWASTTNA